jgi:hypothetical protein
MDAEKELEYLREKVALLQRCLEYERLLREVREAAPKEPAYVPCPYPYPVPQRQPWEPLITFCDVPGPNEWIDTAGNVYHTSVGGGTYPPG